LLLITLPHLQYFFQQYYFAKFADRPPTLQSFFDNILNYQYFFDCGDGPSSLGAPSGGIFRGPPRLRKRQSPRSML
jgi:hypothetical protein